MARDDEMDTIDILINTLYSKKAITILLSFCILVMGAAMWIEIFKQNRDQ